MLQTLHSRNKISDRFLKHDAMIKNHREEEAVPRIVSLIPSGTEMVCALNCGSQLVGRSHECDFPSVVTQLPVCTKPTIDVDDSSHEIHVNVSSRLRKALALYEVLEDRMKDLRPDIIVTQTQCEVCAVSIQDVRRALTDWIGSSPAVIPLSGQNLSGVWADITRIAKGLNQEATAAALLEDYRKRIRNISQECQTRSSTPTVGCIEWLEPLMAAGNWVPELVELAGGRSVFGEPGVHAPWISWEDLCQADPEYILLMPCGFSLSRIRREMPAMTRNSRWNGLQAVRNGKVFLTDGNQFFNRPGPRLVESLEILAEIFHPEQFSFGHQGTGWTN